MIIESIRTQDSREIDLSDINVLVGPNNTGKTQTLQDIQTKMQNERRDTKIIESLDFRKPPSFEEMIEGLPIERDEENQRMRIPAGEQSVTIGFGDWRRWREEFDSLDVNEMMRTLSPVKVSYLDAESRLEIATNKRVDMGGTFLEMLVNDESGAEQELREAFQMTFDKEVLLDYSELKTLRFWVGEEFEDVPDHPRELGKYIEESDAEPLDNQGGGFISFVGVALSLLLSKGKVILLDEPEAFLHPAQARRLGGWIAEQSEEFPSQVVIATHDSDFLAGVLSGGRDISVFRLNRPSMNTYYHRIPPDVTMKLAGDKLLSSQRVQQAIFHKGGIVVEGGSDRAVYQMVAFEDVGQEDLLFVDALSKEAIKNVTEILSDSKVPVAAIADLDVLNNHYTLKQLLMSLPDVDEYEDIQEVMEKRGAVDDEVRSTEDGWDQVKENGIDGVPESVREKAREIIDQVQGFGLFITDVGELEAWMDLGVGKSEWPIEALKVIDSGDTDEDLVSFVDRINDYLLTEYDRIVCEQS